MRKEVNRGWFEENNVEVGDQIDIEEGKKDACYHKVKSRLPVYQVHMRQEHWSNAVKLVLPTGETSLRLRKKNLNLMRSVSKKQWF